MNFPYPSLLASAKKKISSYGKFNPYQKFGKLLLHILIFLFGSQSGFAQLAIQSFAPAFVNTGDTVTITGIGFSAAVGGNFVSFNHLRAQIVSAGSTQIRAIVPPGTSAGPIMVSRSGFSATSSQFFYPNVTPGNFPIDQTNIPLAFERVLGGKVTYVQAADLDGDGWTDIIAGVENPGRIIMERNVSTADSVKFSDSLILLLGNNAFIIEIADLNGDGKPDIVVLVQGSNLLRIFRNNCTPGNLSFAEESPITLSNISYDIAIADFDGDGKQDITTAPGAFPTPIEIFRNNSTESSFSFAKISFVQQPISSLQYFVSGDFNNDGKPDLIAASGTTNSLHILKNTSGGPGNFSFSSATMSLGFPAGFEAGATDLNRDGKPDIVVSSYGYSPRVFLNATTADSIQFQPMFFTGNTFSEGFVSFADLNADGDPDLMVGTYNTINKSGIYENGYPTLPLFGSSLPNLSPFLNSVGADFNRDGNTNLLISGNHTNRYQVFSFQRITLRINDFSPQRATEGTPTTIKGYGFTDAVTVSFGEVDARSFEIKNDSTITAVVGNGASGNVMVSTNGKSATLTGFTYFTKPVLESFSPTSGFPGSEVMLTGTNMQEVHQVRFGGVTADTFFILSNTEIKAIVGAGASGDVTIAGSDWDSSKLVGFTFFPAPEITGINNLKVAPGGEVVISGNHFTPLQMLTIGGLKVEATSASSNSISFKAPPQFIGGGISVKTPYGTDTIYGFYNGATITNVSSLTGKKGDTVTITGTGFIPNTSAIFASIAKQNATVIEATSSQLKIIVPSGPATGTVSLSMNGHTVSGPLPFVFGFNNEGALADVNSFQSFTPFEDIDLSYSIGFKIVDIDMDGRMDLIHLDPLSLTVYRNTSQPGLFSFSMTKIENEFDNSEGLDIMDLNHDGKPDIIINTVSGTQRKLLLSECSPGLIKFANPQIVTKNWLAEYPLWFHDLDKDGRIDIFGFYFFYHNESDLDSFSFNKTTIIDIPGSIASDLAVYDIDGDGNAEVFALKPPYYPENMFHSINTIPGKLTVQKSTTPIPLECNTIASFAADLDNDGKIDLVEFCNGWAIRVFKNTSQPGNIQFSAVMIPVEKEDFASFINVADFNGDGLIDFATFSESKKLISIHINSTTGSEISFLPPIKFPVFDYPDGWEGEYQIEVADLDDDGRIDIIVSGKQLETVQILRNLIGAQIPLFVCKDQPATLTTQRTGSSYQWQQSTNGTDYTNLNSGNGLSGVQSSALNIASVNESFNGRFYRCLVNGIPDIPLVIRLYNRWVGSNDNLWSNAGNWSCGTVPQGDIEVEIDGEVEIDIDVTIGKIILKPGGKVNVAPGKKLTVLH